MPTMTQPTIQLQIPFDSLVNAIATLTIEDKIQLFQLLETEIAQLEEDCLEEDPAVLAEIQESRTAYQAGDYQTLDRYIASRKNKTP
ncbi:MAG: hypothetical protein F6J93_18795 [Oscillatoria sp. SIO1A7]|nr:hypothetical protein [Oscillatoria sp. SIO1A7]